MTENQVNAAKEVGDIFSFAMAEPVRKEKEKPRKEKKPPPPEP